MIHFSMVDQEVSLPVTPKFYTTPQIFLLEYGMMTSYLENE